MKTCVTCDWLDASFGHNCAHNKTVVIHPVYGPQMPTCATARAGGECGPDGKLWEARRSFMARITSATRGERRYRAAPLTM